MQYNSVLNVKAKKENRREFCSRIVKWLNDILFKYDSYYTRDGKSLINKLFKSSDFNNGYSDIDDLLNEAGYNNSSIFELCKKNNSDISEEEIFANIDIIANCIFIANVNVFFHKEEAKVTIQNIFKAIDQYLLACGYILKNDEHLGRLVIVSNNILIDVSEINDNKIKSDVLDFYNYKNNNIDEKKKIILLLAGKLEPRHEEISNILGKRVADIYSNYVNNINIRHNNVSLKNKNYYNPKVASLSNEELIKWYDYIFAFLMNIYLSLGNLKDININDGCK